MKKLLYSLLATFTLFACSTTTPDSQVINENENSMTQDFIELFKINSNESCIANGNKKENCECYTNTILETFTFDDFSIIYKFITTEKNANKIISNPVVGPKILKASNKCFYKK